MSCTPSRSLRRPHQPLRKICLLRKHRRAAGRRQGPGVARVPESPSSAAQPRQDRSFRPSFPSCAATDSLLRRSWVPRLQLGARPSRPPCCRKSFGQRRGLENRRAGSWSHGFGCLAASQGLFSFCIAMSKCRWLAVDPRISELMLMLETDRPVDVTGRTGGSMRLPADGSS